MEGQRKGKLEIVAEVARLKVVETIISNVSRQPVTGDLRDLAQDIYCAILKTDEAYLQEAYEAGRLRFFIARIVTNQLRSPLSPFYYKYKNPRRRSREVNENDLTTDNADI